MDWLWLNEYAEALSEELSDLGLVVIPKECDEGDYIGTVEVRERSGAEWVSFNAKREWQDAPLRWLAASHAGNIRELREAGDEITDEESVRNGVVVRLRNTEWAKEAGLVYSPLFGDVAKTYYVRLDSGRMGYAVRQNLLDSRSLSLEELDRIAQKNTVRDCPAVTLDFQEVSERTGIPAPELSEEDELEIPSMFVLTNEHRFFGATAILYPGELDKLMNELDSEVLLILPESVHSVFVMPAPVEEHLAFYAEMVRDVNRTLPPELVLSDSLYLYFGEGRFSELRYREEVA